MTARTGASLAAEQASQAAIDAHRAAWGGETDLGDNVDLWQLLYSLVEWCSLRGVDLDAELASVRAEVRS